MDLDDEELEATKKLNGVHNLNYYIDGYYDEVGIINNTIKEIQEIELYGTGAYKITDKDIENLKNRQIIICSTKL